MKKITGLLLMFIILSCAPKNDKIEKTDDALRFSMQTRWTDSVSLDKPWDVYPRPQMKRQNWQNLNGLWDYAITAVTNDIPEEFEGEILVPYAVESELSKVKRLVGKDNNLWYRTRFSVPTHTAEEKIHLNFGAVDWETTIFLNGQRVGIHKGGFTPFSFDITPYLKDGEQELIVKVWDPTDSETQARGKQVADPFGIWYTPVTGIWQTVWLEKTGQDYIKLVKNTPDIDNNQIHSEIVLGKITGALKLRISALEGTQTLVTEIFDIDNQLDNLKVTLDIPSPVLWSPDNPHLYDLEIEILKDNRVIDKVESYFGMRKVSLGKDNNGYTRIMLNDNALFQFGLLDQGWFPDGLYTAPTYEAMLYDIEMTEQWGFNMIRKHVKVEPATFYYECDKRGMLVWQDMPNGNYLEELRIQAWEENDAHRDEASSKQFEWELQQMMDELHSFPSILVWVPFNEGWGQYDTERVTEWTEEYDPSRLIDSPSGWADRGVGDMVDVHLYPGPGMEMPEENRAAVLGEFAGIGLPVRDHMWWDKKNWGYLTYNDQSIFKTKFKEIIRDLESLKSFGLSAAVYTQTTDVEGEVNGLMTYDRDFVKIDPAEMRPMLEPLYKEVPNHISIIADSETIPNQWYVTKVKTANWPNVTDFKEWVQKDAPFSSYENYFLPVGSSWTGADDMFLTKDFDLHSVPDELIMRFYLDKASMKIYINGNLIAEEKFEGGRKRHYRNIVIGDANTFLKSGNNTVSIELEAIKDDHAFDLGLYAIDHTEEVTRKPLPTE